MNGFVRFCLFPIPYDEKCRCIKIIEKKMAKIPQGASLIYNPSSAAPGFITKNILSLPGVPSILNSMIENCKRFLIKGLKINVSNKGKFATVLLFINVCLSYFHL